MQWGMPTTQKSMYQLISLHLSSAAKQRIIHSQAYRDAWRQYINDIHSWSMSAQSPLTDPLTDTILSLHSQKPDKHPTFGFCECGEV